jgi:hypothetical protein
MHREAPDPAEFPPALCGLYSIRLLKPDHLLAAGFSEYERPLVSCSLCLILITRTKLKSRLQGKQSHGSPKAGSAAKDSLKNNFTFYTPMHLFRLRCESSEYPDIPAFSRPLERDDTSILKMMVCRLPKKRRNA